MRLKSAFVFGLALVAAASAACSDDDEDGVPVTDPEFPDSVAADLQRTIDQVVADGVAPGVSIAVLHPTHHRFIGVAGVASRESGAPLTAEHRFRAGSMLKTAVAAAVLQLVERGERSLDEKLTDVLPASTTNRIPEAAKITLRMLLNHTAGIPEFSREDFDAEVLRNPRRVWSVAELLDLSGAQPRPFAPGAGWMYSNADYVLLGEVIEVTTKRSWRQIVDERVLRRADLHHSKLPPPGDASCGGCAHGYELVDGALVELTEVDPSMAGAAGGEALITTPADLAQLLDALDRGELFDKPGTLSLMKTFTPAPLPEEAQTDYGLGLTRFEVGDERGSVELVGHLGGTVGFQGFMLKDTRTGVVVSGEMTMRGDLGAFILPVLEAVARIP